MTIVTLERSKRKYYIHARGHATGSPECCAAVSCLLYTLAGWLKNSRCKVEDASLDDAHAFFCWHGRKAGTAFEMMAVGFLQLEKTCPEHICVRLV